MNEPDGFRIEAALQFGFEQTADDCPRYACTESQLIAFAKACERKGLARVATYLRERESVLDKSHDLANALVAGAVAGIAEGIEAKIAAIDAELKPTLEAEEVRFMTAQGYVRGTTDEPGKRWVHPSKPTPTRPDIDALAKSAMASFDAMTPEQQAAHRREQAESWVRGEKGIGDL